MSQTLAYDASKEVIEYIKSDPTSAKLEEISSALLAIANYQKAEKKPAKEIISLINEVIVKLTNVDEEKIQKIDSVLNNLNQSFDNFTKEYEKKDDENSKIIKTEFLEMEDKISNTQEFLSQNSKRNFEAINKSIAKCIEDLSEKLMFIEAKVNTEAIEKMSDSVVSMAKENANLNDKVDKFKDEFVDLTVNSNMSVSQEILNVKQNINDIQALIDEKYQIIEDNTSKLDGEIEKYTNEVDSRLNHFSEHILMQVIQLFDNISFVSETEDIKDFVSLSSNTIDKGIGEIKEFVSDANLTTQEDLNEIKHLLNIMPREREENINRLSEQIENLSSNLTKNLNYELKNNIVIPIKGILTSLIDFKSKINNILDKDTLDIELKAFNETMLVQMAELFENVSFEEEAEDIKACFREEFSEIEETLKNELSILGEDLRDEISQI